MGGVLAGFATIAVVIGFGILLAHVGVVDAAGQRMLSAVAFFLASPALLFTVLLDSDLDRVFSLNVVAIVAGVVATGAVTVAVGVARREDTGRTMVATLCSSYCNAGNLGLVAMRATVLAVVTWAHRPFGRDQTQELMGCSAR